MTQRYTAAFTLAMFVFSMLVGCASAPTPTPPPFIRHTPTQVLDHLQAAGLSVIDPRRDLVVPPDTPMTFNDRYLFQIAAIAPFGGQVLTFSDAADMQTWLDHIERLRASSQTRREVVYVFTHDNVILWLNPVLSNALANPYRDALATLGAS